jgi:hypothetical protein
MLVLLSLVPLSPSLLLAIQRLPSTSPVTVVVPDGDELASKLPRHVTLEHGKGDAVLERIAKLPPTACVAVIRDTLLFLPESLGLACAVAQDQPSKYVTFVDTTGKQESRGVLFSVQRHWSVSPSLVQSFVTLARNLQDDADVWREVWDGSPMFQWSAVEVLGGKAVLCPLPSLAAPLPLNESSPPGVQWQTLLEFVNKTV